MFESTLNKHTTESSLLHVVTRAGTTWRSHHMACSRAMRAFWDGVCLSEPALASAAGAAGATGATGDDQIKDELDVGYVPDPIVGQQYHSR